MQHASAHRNLRCACRLDFQEEIKMYRTPPNRHEFLFYVCQTVALGCLIAGALWMAMN
jgi:hypothetical protein